MPRAVDPLRAVGWGSSRGRARRRALVVCRRGCPPAGAGPRRRRCSSSGRRRCSRCARCRSSQRLLRWLDRGVVLRRCPPRRHAVGRSRPASRRRRARRRWPRPPSPSLTCVQRRERRREADVAVARVVARSGNDAPAGVRAMPASLASCDDPGGGAVEHVEADEVAAGRAGSTSATPRPPSRSVRAALDRGELRRDDLAVPGACGRARPAAEPKNCDVPQLVDLVGADRRPCRGGRGTTSRSRPTPARNATPAPA